MMSAVSIARLDSLTGMRWWAAFFVFSFHMGVLAPLPFQDYLHIGHTGVSFFFILSGFVLTWSAQPHVGAQEFWWRRFARIWPSHIVALIVAIPVFYSWVLDSNDPGWVKEFSFPIIALSFVLLQGFFTSWHILFSGNPAAWTLTCEAFFYLLHPFIAPRKQVSHLFIGGLLVGSLVVGWMIHAYDPDSQMIPAPLARVWEFTLGIGIAYASKRGMRVSAPSTAIFLMLLGMTFGYYWLRETPLRETSVLVSALSDGRHVLLAAMYALIISIMATRDICEQRSWAKHPVLVRLGEWSYAFYLLHSTIVYMLLYVVGRIDWHPVVTPTVWAAVLVCALTAAGVLHHYIEKPCERFLRHFGKVRWFATPVTNESCVPTVVDGRVSNQAGITLEKTT